MDPTPIKRLLIANRGEIAVRVAQTCRKLGIHSIGVYSEADRRALHVATADESVFIGPAEARFSYLAIDKIIDAARAANADAVHPGYGFLSENAEFARAVIDAGLIWVGPHPDAIREMGSKFQARRLAVELGVPLVPGYDGDNQSDDHMQKEAERIGYPIMLKASAGGGGRGIRIVRKKADFAATLRQAKQEARVSFGDDRMIVERYVEKPRHVEVQVIGDKHGGLAHVFTRDCSVQRRHQKVIEEAPAPGIPDATREKIHEAALTLARKMKYDNAGTVEFLYEESADAFYFLEMNTRLQVEHPVTEAITGLDLVELQILSAEGAPLPPLLQTIEPFGVAIEARICAESAEKDFQPDSGTVFNCAFGEYVRVDTGIESGRAISPFYDSMVAKVIAHAPTREEAVAALIRALDQQQIAGVETNTQYVRDILSTDAFRSGDLSTHFLETHLKDWQPTPPDAAILTAIGAALYADRLEIERKQAGHDTPWDTLGPWRLTHHGGHEGQTHVLIEAHGTQYAYHVSGRAGRFNVQGVEAETNVSIVEREPAAAGAMRLRVEVDGIQKPALVYFDGNRMLVSVGREWLWTRLVPRGEQYVSEAHQHTASEADIISPYPGLVTDVNVAAGESVSAGDVVVVMESMKIIHHLTATVDGVVKAVHCKPDQSVETGALLVEFETDETEQGQAV
jgi:3-methylcrotonyl-CoA carboxylase alpha subunit